jgi:hypothetical protein
VWRRSRPSQQNLFDYHPAFVDHDFLDRTNNSGIDASEHDDIKSFHTGGRPAKSHLRLP